MILVIFLLYSFQSEPLTVRSAALPCPSGSFTLTFACMLQVDLAITAMAFLNVLTRPLNLIPQSFAALAEGMVSLNRLDGFFSLPELQPKSTVAPASPRSAAAWQDKNHNNSQLSPRSAASTAAAVVPASSATALESPRLTQIMPAPAAAPAPASVPALRPSALSAATASSDAISIQNADFRWLESSPKPVLSGIDLQVKRGSLVGVIGLVGAGKTSLIAAILGELHRSAGALLVQPHATQPASAAAGAAAPAANESTSEPAAASSGIAFTAQEPWVRNATVRDNILCGLPMRSELYERVLQACALAPDLAILPDGDSTEIGERGITLSGGQKARVALARAAYRMDSSDVYLLDDPISAVDMGVADHIHRHCITGLLKGKTRVVVLNSHLHVWLWTSFSSFSYLVIVLTRSFCF